ncbi:MAG: hypothetical protein MUO42_03055 [Anaerolineaceae bacterium]|jgi:hypothetical protein|nr:hypothetical protein [Anaerolineaceae bacterium]
MADVPFMRPPVLDDTFHVGEIVEAYCDHAKGDQRIKGWLKGTIVQIDMKLIAVQFRTNVYLTDGWMVPDHILWYPMRSPQLRKKPAGSNK